MFAELRLRSGTNWSSYTIIPKFKDLAFDTKYQDIGSFGFTITQDDAEALGLADDSVIEIAPNGISRFNMWYAVDNTSGSKTADDTLWKTISGKSIINWLADCRVYPSSWPTLPVVNPDGTTTPIVNGHGFQNATPGTILRTLIARGKSRGGLSWLDETSFTGTTTTDGQAWATTLSPTYDTGTTLLQVLQDLATRRLIQFRMNGMQLQVYNYDSQISHKTPEQVTFRRGQNLEEQTTNTDSSAAASVVLIQGDQTAIAEVNTLPDGSSPSVTRRRELFVAQGGITDIPTLQFLAKAQLAINGHIKVEESLGVDDSLEPWNAYDVGDWVWEDKSGTLENLQIKQIAATAQDANNLTIGLTLGDMLDDLDSQFQQRIDSITGANAANYGPLPNTIKNFLAPSAPTTVSANATAYRDNNGIDHSQVSVTWAAPTTNVDGSTLIDLDRYEVQYRTDQTSAWQQAANVPGSQTAAYISNLPTGINFIAQVRAVDTDGNASAWGVMSGYIATPKVLIVPATPSAPTVSSVFQSIEVTWDGKNSSGGSYGSEWARTDVYVGTTSTFVPGTPAESFNMRGGSLTVGGLAYATTYYVKLIAVDKSGNVSPASAASSAVTAAQLSDPDLPAKLVTGAKIADGTISTTQLTVASFGDTIQPNGSFEDLNSATTTGAAHWVLSFNNVIGATVSTLTSGGATGTNCLKVSLPASTSGLTHWTAGQDEIPTAPGDLWYVKGKIKADRSQAVACAILLSFGQAGGAALPIILDGNNPVSTVVTLTPTTAWTEFEGQLLVPSGTLPNPITRMKVILSTASDGASNNIYWDDIAVRPVGGSASIKDASIVNAKIANVAADKITVGTLNADITVASRIKTADTGARVELNSTGIHAYDASNNQTLYASDADGSVNITGAFQGGSIDLPSISTGSSFRLHADAGGLTASGAGVTNLVTDPSLEASPAQTVKDIHTSTVWDTTYALFGSKCLRVNGDGTDLAGYTEYVLTQVQPSTTYTLSIYVGMYNTITYSTPPGPQPVRADFTNFLGRVGATTIFSGYDGYYDYLGNNLIPTIPTASSVGVVGQQSVPYLLGSGSIGTSSLFNTPPGTNSTSKFTRRYFKAFTTPSSIAANSNLVIRLPAVVYPDNTGAYASFLAMFYDGVQLEAGVLLPGTYTDGNLPDCTWSGLTNASTSSRGFSQLMVLNPNSAPNFPSGFIQPAVLEAAALSSASRTAGTAIPLTAIVDPLGGWTGSSYTVQQSGVYMIMAQVKTTTAPAVGGGYVTKNGSTLYISGAWPTAANVAGDITFLKYLKQGDVIDLRSTVTITNNTDGTFLTLARIG